MAIEHSDEPVSSELLVRAAHRLLDSSTLCAIATVGAGGDAYVNTAYFAWSQPLALVWLSHPDARHSQNIRDRGTTAAAVFDSRQTWGEADRGIQLFGASREVGRRDEDDARATYAQRFADFDRETFAALRFYELRPSAVKVFDEPEFGGGRFVAATVDAEGQMTWERTDAYPT